MLHAGSSNARTLHAHRPTAAIPTPPPPPPPQQIAHGHNKVLLYPYELTLVGNSSIFQDCSTRDEGQNSWGHFEQSSGRH